MRRIRSRPQSLLPALAALLILGAALWLGGLAWFVHAMPVAVTDPDSRTDAIVALTGGSLRVQNALALLAAGKARKLLISGVPHGVELTDLLRVSQSPEPESCCVVLGHAAESTYGNARETASWMHAEGFRSLRLVTSSYHMPRSLLEFARIMPEVTIVPHPVFPDFMKTRLWWVHPAALSLVLGEYDKYLGALLRPLLPFEPQKEALQP